MATYRANVTQNIEPAQANVGFLQRAAELQAGAARSKAEAIGTALSAGTAAYKGYVQGEIDSATQEAGAAAKEFFESNRQAVVDREAMLELQSQRSTFVGNIMGTPPTQETTAVGDVMAGFDAEIERLRAAAQSGMKPQDFLARINTATRKAVAQFPGRADEIRQRVSRATGIEHADQFEQMRYIQGVFREGRGGADDVEKTRLALAKNDIARAADLGIASQEELFEMWRTGDPRYGAIIKRANEAQATKFAVENITNNVASLRGQSDFEASQQSIAFGTMFDGYLSTNVLTSVLQDDGQALQNTLALMKKGDPASVDPTQFKVLADLWGTQMLSVIDDAYTNSARVQEQYFRENPNISEAKKNEMRNDLKVQADLYKSRYTSEEGLRMSAAIFSTYKDKTIAEQQQKLNLAISMQTAFQNSDLSRKYWLGGADREDVKIRFPDFFKVMSDIESLMTEGTQGVRDPMLAAKKLANVERILVEASTTGEASVPSPAEDRTTIRAANELVFGKALEALNKTNLAAGDINVIKSALSTATEVGANSRILSNEYKNIGKKVLALPEPVQNEIKGQVSSSIQTSVSSVQAIKTFIEQKYGVTLTLGVNDAGQMSVVMPSTRTARGARPTATSNMQTAANEFMNQTRPMLNNMVYGHAMLTQDQPVDIGAKMADVINSNQPFEGFFNLEPSVRTGPPGGARASRRAGTGGVRTETPAETPDTETPSKIASISEVIELANREGITVDEAISGLESDGYTIGD
jgi:hypothetical protein